MVATPEVLLLLVEVASLAGLLWLVYRSELSYTTRFFVALVVLFEGLSISLLISAVPRWVGLALVLAGGYTLVRLLRERPGDLPGTESIASHFLERVTLGGRLTVLFPVVGAALIVVDLVANYIYFNGRLGSNDFVILTLGAVYLGYNYVPANYERERDFAFIFLNVLTLLLVVPVTIYNLATGSATSDTDTLAESRIVNMFLARPLDNLLSLLGYEVWADGGSLYYQDLEAGRTSVVSIASGCSGIYSATIFIAAFLAWVATEYQVFDRLVGLLLALGILTAYLANLLRMAIIVLVGHYYGGDALTWAHANVGWMIFLGWVGAFWWLLFAYLVEPGPARVPLPGPLPEQGPDEHGLEPQTMPEEEPALEEGPEPEPAMEPSPDAMKETEPGDMDEEAGEEGETPSADGEELSEREAETDPEGDSEDDAEGAPSPVVDEPSEP